MGGHVLSYMRLGLLPASCLLAPLFYVGLVCLPRTRLKSPIVDHPSSRSAGWKSLFQKQQIDARGSTFNDIGRDQHNHFYIFADQDPSTNADHQKMDVDDMAANKGTGVNFVLY